MKKFIGWDEKMNGSFSTSLHNLDNDIKEEKNLSEEFPEIIEKLTRLIQTNDIKQ